MSEAEYVGPSGALRRFGPFLGREKVLQELRNRITSGASLVSVVGPPGVGKTRLCQEFLASTQGRTVDCAALGVDGLDAEVRRLDASNGAEDLVVVDNFDPDVYTPGLTVAMDASPGRRWIVVCLEPIGVRGEHIIELGGLEATSLQGTAGPAIELIAFHAALRKSDFTPETDFPTLVTLARLLEGLPFGLEIIGSRLQRTDPKDLLAQIEGDIGKARRTNRDVPERHRSVEAAVRWSLDRCSPTTNNLLRYLAWIGGPVRLSLLPHCVDGIDELVDVDLDETLDHCGERRLVLLRGTPVPMVEVSGPVTAVLRGDSAPAGLGRFVDLLAEQFVAEAASNGLLSKEQIEVLDLESMVIDRMLTYLCADRSPRFAQLVQALTQWWLLTGRFEPAQRWAEEAARQITLPDEQWPLLVTAIETLLSQGAPVTRVTEVRKLFDATLAGPAASAVMAVLDARIALQAGDASAAATYCAHALELAQLPQARLVVLHNAAKLAVATNAKERAVVLMNEAIPLAALLDDLHRTLTINGELAALVQPSTEISALDRLRRTLSLAESLGRDSPQQAMLLAELAHTEYQRRRFVVAGEIIDRAVAIAERVCTPLDLAIIRELEAIVGSELVDQGTARQKFIPILEAYRQQGVSQRIRSLVADIAVLPLGLPAESRLLFLVVSASSLDPGPIDDYWSRRREGVRRTLEGKLSRAKAIRINAESRSVSPDSLALLVIEALRQTGNEVRIIQGLTARESAVAFAMAKGLTDREIAEELVVGVRTVNTHVQSVLRKASLKRRTEMRLWIEQQSSSFT